MKNLIFSLISKFSNYLGLKDLIKINAKNLINNLYNSSRYQDSKCLIKFGYSVFSQGDEDGIINEIFSRIKVKNKIFVEIGVENGLENNTTNLLIDDWSGLWIEGNKKWKNEIDNKFKVFLNNKRLSVVYEFLNKENVNDVLKKSKLKDLNIDLLSIDIGLQTYHVLKSIDIIKPRVIVAEYNAKYGPHNTWVVKYSKESIWQNDSYMGVSLALLTDMLKDKGYSLVGCSITGANAFFINNNENLKNFLEPFSSQKHFEEEKYYLLRHFSSYHKKNFGEFEKE